MIRALLISVLLATMVTAADPPTPLRSVDEPIARSNFDDVEYELQQFFNGEASMEVSWLAVGTLESSQSITVSGDATVVGDIDGTDIAASDDLTGLKIAAQLNVRAEQTVTVSAGGAIALTKGVTIYRVAGAGGASDDLSDITGGAEGDVVILRALDDADTITVKNDGGSPSTEIWCGADKALDSIRDTIVLTMTNGSWLMLSFADNAP